MTSISCFCETHILPRTFVIWCLSLRCCHLCYINNGSETSCLLFCRFILYADVYRFPGCMRGGMWKLIRD